MKPITLKIAGLHSFREEQEIPFDQLSELGVFGIFGPTGSGKSSILDAMTLALYGTVVRAGRRTQGILNHAEKNVKVSFTFSLGQGRERRVYRVERRYARKDQLAVNNTHSRLIAVREDQEEVMADKDREVTEQITGLLGLKEEDFTRAVVLPQGKFAEFLSLGGKERREMLQRLFSLEQYGNVLINKVNDHVKSAETSYIEVESEQKGLGDASPAAVANAQAVLVLARQAEEQAVMEYKLAEEQYSEAKEVYNLQNEVAKKQVELAGHRQQQSEIEQTAAALELAERAGRAAAIAEEFSTSQTTEETAATAKQQASERANLLAEEGKRLDAAYNNAREVRLKREPELIEQRIRLEAARKLEEQVNQLAEDVAVLAAQQKKQQIAAKTASTVLEQQAGRSQSLIDRIKEFEQKVSGASISAGQRAKVQECLASAQALMQNMAAADKIKQAGVLRKQQFDVAEAAAKQAEENRRQVELRLGTLEAAEAKAAEAQLKAASAQLDQLLASERLAAAARLAGELVEGKPCPVCGSGSHPHPATSEQGADKGNHAHFEQEIAAAKERIANLTQTLAETGKAVAAERQRLVEVGATAAGLSQQAATALAEVEKIRAEYIEARDAVNVVCEQLNQALQVAGKKLGSAVSADTVLAHVQELAAYISNQDKSTEALNKQLASQRQEYDSCQAEINSLQRSVQAAEAELAGLTARVDAANEHLAAKQLELAAITQGIPASQLLARIAQALELVRREESLAKESAEQVAEALAAAEQARTRAETSWLEAAERRKTLQARLYDKLTEEGFADVSAMTAAHMPAARQEAGRRLLKTYAETEQRLIAQCEQLLEALKGRQVTEADWEQSKQTMAQTEAGKNTATQERVEADKEYRDLSVKHQRWLELETVRLRLKEQRDCLLALRTLLRGNVFVEFLAQEQMELVARQASERLKQITQHRYALELNSDGGFLIRDDANGGVKRPVSTLSGGETFQTALALSLALSAQIQLKGKYPLEFFFLDEGFGSLDQHALDVAMSTLEKLHIERLTIGIISHVAELKQRMQRRLLVDPAEPAGRGSRVRVEEA
ncbi:AAA family ATPase [Sporomusa malonica]|uniref:Nuclease SbcCD subunit C n=1 Tax=Sporomusa malonica TaxID=112901 RepID=A0A1W2EYN9_9FIRM|nr:SMC family ATPase [Sporomusa malonica]SMD14760.1 exonuclease SbcC [Sporomusa malonica]